MKKYLSIFLILSLMCVFAAGCSDKGASGTEGVPEAESGVAKIQEDSPAEAEGVDVDLTVLSSTVVYAEVYNMTVSPDDYTGKTIKMSGPYYAFYSDETGLYYHCVIIEDATACCQRGLEFMWNGDHAYPDDYPEENTKIEVSGVFESYEELGRTYYHLVVDDISVLE